MSYPDPTRDGDRAHGIDLAKTYSIRFQAASSDIDTAYHLATAVIIVPGSEAGTNWEVRLLFWNGAEIPPADWNNGIVYGHLPLAALSEVRRLLDSQVPLEAVCKKQENRKWVYLTQKGR